MKHIFIILLTLISFISCRKENDTPDPEIQAQNPDWYILRAPENREIQAVYGDIDGTLLITDRFRIYYTKDMGKTWNQANYSSNIGLAGFTMSNDTLFVLDTETSNGADPGNRYAIRPYYFSVDGGITWKKLQKTAETPEMKTPLNYGNSKNGIRFSINQVIKANGGVEYLGVKSENGSLISLPQRHVLTNVTFDAKSRLYVSGSAPLCDINGYTQLCDEGDVRGTLYISKRSIGY